MPSFRVADKFLYSKCGAVNMCTGVICSRVGTGDIAEASRVNWGTKVLQGRVKKAEDLVWVVKRHNSQESRAG